MSQYDGTNNNGLANGGGVPGMGVGNGALQADGMFGGHVNNGHNAHAGVLRGLCHGVCARAYFAFRKGRPSHDRNYT